MRRACPHSPKLSPQLVSEYVISCAEDGNLLLRKLPPGDVPVDCTLVSENQGRKALHKRLNYSGAGNIIDWGAGIDRISISAYHLVLD
jgi:hypothetical protein